MTDNNGSKPPIPFHPPQGEIPIIGQPYKLHGILPQVLISCTCDAKDPVLLIGIGAQGQCHGCGRLFILDGVNGSKGGKVEATIGVGIQRKVTDA